LPLHHFIPIADAFVQAKSRLGSGELAVRDLTQHARNRRLTVAARVILHGRPELCVIIRSAFWRHYEILRFSALEGIRGETAGVRGPGRLPGGAWYFFVGRRQFEQLYFTAALIRPVARQAPLSPSVLQPPASHVVRQEPPDVRLPEEPQLEAPIQRQPDDPKAWLREARRKHPQESGESMTGYARRLYGHMEREFEEPPWGDADALRRRLYDQNYS
jgi:hypothetical protein